MQVARPALQLKALLTEPRRHLRAAARRAADQHTWHRVASRLSIALAERDTPQTPLIAAARRGDVTTLQTLLAQGAAANAQGPHGRTALFEAVLHAHVDAAACLLACGSNPYIADRRGRTPLSLGVVTPETLHAIRQRYHRWPAPHAAQPLPSPDVQRWVDCLRRDGIVKISGLIAPDELARMQAAVDRFVVALDAQLAKGQGLYLHYDEEEHFWPHGQAYVTNNAFKYSRDFVRLCCRTPLVDAANLYFGKPAFIQRALAMRYPPSPSRDNDMFGWHHDMDDKRFKVMVLLSNVGTADQCMSYALGTHRIFHPYAMFFQNECSLDYCRAHLGTLEIYDAVGVAGDVFVFDSNGAHRGNRRQSAAVRDVLLVEYTTDRSEIWGGDIDADLAEELGGPNRPLERFVTARKKWTLPFVRRFPAWVENLPHVDRWL